MIRVYSDNLGTISGDTSIQKGNFSALDSSIDGLNRSQLEQNQKPIDLYRISVRGDNFDARSKGSAIPHRVVGGKSTLKIEEALEDDLSSADVKKPPSVTR